MHYLLQEDERFYIHDKLVQKIVKIIEDNFEDRVPLNFNFFLAARSSCAAFITCFSTSITIIWMM